MACPRENGGHKVYKVCKVHKEKSILIMLYTLNLELDNF